MSKRREFWILKRNENPGGHAFSKPELAHAASETGEEIIHVVAIKPGEVVLSREEFKEAVKTFVWLDGVASLAVDADILELHIFGPAAGDGGEW